jgi:hypothetical protein
MAKRIVNHHELDVYKKAFAAAMELFEASKKFPKEEMYSLTSQMRRSSRSVNANITEAWRKRRYEAHFISKLSDAETEAAERRRGSSSPSTAATSTRPLRRSCTVPTTK